MSEDWASVAAEVADAIKDVASTDEGYPATIRQIATTGGNAWDPDSGTSTPTNTTLRVVEFEIRERDRDGSAVGVKRRTLMVGTEAGVVPAKGDTIAPGVAKGDVTSSTQFYEIVEVYPLAPAGTALLYEIDLAV